MWRCVGPAARHTVARSTRSSHRVDYIQYSNSSIEIVTMGNSIWYGRWLIKAVNSECWQLIWGFEPPIRPAYRSLTLHDLSFGSCSLNFIFWPAPLRFHLRSHALGKDAESWLWSLFRLRLIHGLVFFTPWFGHVFGAEAFGRNLHNA